MDRKKGSVYSEITGIKHKTTMKQIWVQNYKKHYFFYGYRGVYREQQNLNQNI